MKIKTIIDLLTKYEPEGEEPKFDPSCIKKIIIFTLVLIVVYHFLIKIILWL